MSGTTQTNPPDYIRPYLEYMLSQARDVAAQTDMPRYVDAAGNPIPRVADPGYDTQSFYYGVRNLATSPQSDLISARNTFAQAAEQAGGLANFEPGRIDLNYGPAAVDAMRFGSSYQAPGEYAALNPDVATFDAEARDRYMSPYIQSVIDAQKEQAVNDFERDRARRDARAIQSGAYGGSRSAVEEGVSRDALQRQMNQITATGLQSGYENAQGQFERDRQAYMGGLQMGEQSRQFGAGFGDAGNRAQAELGLRAGQLTDASRLAAAQFGEQSRMNAANTALSMFGANEGARTAAANTALNATNMLGQQGGNFANLGSLFNTLQKDNLGMLGAIGGQQDQNYQNRLDIGYQDWLTQNAFPRENLSFFSNILRGMPVQNQTQVFGGYQPTNSVNSLFGAGLTGLGLYNMMGRV